MSVPKLNLSNGAQMPILGFGTWNAKDEELEAALECALEAGYRHIDTAYVYQNEHVIGNVLKRWLDAGKVKREELFIVTKLPNFANRESMVEKFLDLSLSKLKLSYVDLYLIHTPFGLNYHDDNTMIPMTADNKADIDYSTDLVSIWKKMEEMVDRGKAKGIGVSNFNTKQMERILKIARIPPVTNQIELHIYLQQKEMEKLAKENNFVVTAYSPLGTAGVVKFFKELGITYELPNLLSNPVVQDIAKEVGRTPAQVLLRHTIQRGIACIPKSTNPERMKQNLNVFDFVLSSEQASRLDALNQNASVLNMKEFFKKVGSSTGRSHLAIMADKRFVTSKSGFSMPSLGLGTWQSAEEECERAVNGALSAGYKLIDTAYFYQNEAIIGRVLKQWFDSGKVKREDLFIVTKLPFNGNKAEEVDRLVDASLKNLQLDYLDLYLMHGPFTMVPKGDGTFEIDHSTDLIAVYKAMERQVARGKTRAIGVSNFNREQVERVLKIATVRPAVNQIELHLYLQQPELVKYLKSNDIVIMAYSPLGSPGSTTFYEGRGVAKEIPAILKNPVVLELSEKYKKSPAQILLRHLVQNDLVAIPKSGNPKRIAENIDIFDFELADGDMKRLDGLNCNRRIAIFRDAFPGLEKHPEYPFKDEM